MSVNKYNQQTQTHPTVDNKPVPLDVRVTALSKSFMRDGKRLEVLRDIGLTVPAGKFVTVLGPSGSGKSTLLGILAGLDQPNTGSVTLSEASSSAPMTERLGRVGYMPQRDLLLPWWTALDNATAGLEVQGVTKREARAKALPLFDEFGLAGFANSLPHELSGGMRQRVSFLRSALVARGLMLLDEPFGGLDALTRASMQEWLLETTERLTSTFILVTHDIDEAVLLSDRVYVLSPRPGRVIKTLDIDLPRPRSLELARDPRFGDYRLLLLETLRSSGSLSSQGAARA